MTSNGECPHCMGVQEDAEHLICKCPRYVASRQRAFPGRIDKGEVSPTVLVEDQSGVLLFLKLAGRLRDPLEVEVGAPAPAPGASAGYAGRKG